MSTTASLTTIAICQIIITVGGLLAIIGLLYFLISTRKMIGAKTDQIMAKMQPMLDQATSIAEQARETTDKVSAKVDAIMTKAESTAGRVTDKVDVVTSRVEESVNPQIATAAGLMGAAVRFYQLYQDLSKLRKQSTGKQAEQPQKVECRQPVMSDVEEIESHI